MKKKKPALPRVMWDRNPRTQVQPNRKKQHWRKRKHKDLNQMAARNGRHFFCLLPGAGPDVVSAYFCKTLAGLSVLQKYAGAATVFAGNLLNFSRSEHV